MRGLILVALAFAASPVHAEVFKCRAPDGSLSYQDEPCAEGTALDAPVLDPPPAPGDAPAPPASPTIDAEPPAPRAEITLEDTPPPDRDMPVLFRCVRYDGQESVVTDTPQPKRYFVPTWAVVADGAPGRANTKRQPAPRVLNEPPQAATGYVWVEDRCDRLQPDDACDYWKTESREADRLARIAFDAEREQLERREVEFRANFDAWCR